MTDGTLRLRRVGRTAAAAAFLLLLAVFGAPEAALAQCAMCRDAVASSTSETREAVNYAIMGLAFAPYGVAALAAWALSPKVRGHVRARLARLPFRGPVKPS